MNRLLLVILLFAGSIHLSAQEKRFDFSFDGQAIAWTNMNFSDPFQTQFGLRYIPGFSPAFKLNEKWKLDAEIAANSYASTLLRQGEFESTSRLKPYRLWLRLSSDRLELRAGLQKINFGPARMIRPLMWFDKIDPRDPLQLTDGVYGLLARYYFLNNTNIWLWALYGNDDLKGWESVPTKKKTPEFGGRAQFPLLNGESGVSFNYRTAGPAVIEYSPLTLSIDEFPEYKVGLDGRWDPFIGLWYEAVIKNRNNATLIPDYETYLNLGMDYTFGIGNGLGVTLEHFFMEYSEKLLKNGTKLNFTASNVSYPLGLRDQVSAIFYYDWSNNELYSFMNLERQYEKISLYLMAYWNPESFNLYRNVGEQSLFTGKGFQFMIVYNH